MADIDDTLYPRRDDPSDETEGRRQYGYPTDLDQRQEYPGYGYGLANSGYNDGYQHYKNYFQKRNLGDSDPGGFGDERGDGPLEPQKRKVSSLTKALLRNRESGQREYEQNANVHEKPSDGSDDRAVVRDDAKRDSQKAGRGEIKKGTSQHNSIVGQGSNTAAVDGKKASDQSQLNKQKAGKSHTAKTYVAPSGRRKGSKDSRKDANHKDSDLDQHVNVVVKKKASDSKSRKKSKKPKKSEAKDNKAAQPRFMKRKRRHVGPHDDNGLQRLLSTGTLAPSTLPKGHPDYAHTVDVVFATYWFFPARTKAILPEDQRCIEQRMAGETERFDPKSECGSVI